MIWYINRITVEFKCTFHFRSFFVAYILIESQWNLNSGITVLKPEELDINRITVEFKCKMPLMSSASVVNINRITVEFKWSYFWIDYIVPTGY